jgi:hypothetical protein
VALAVPAAWAHHSFAAEFDSAKPIVLRGRITKIAWMNPHVYLWIDAENSNGKVTNWAVESAAPNYLLRLGWTKQSVKPGDIVTIRAFAAKDQSNLAKSDSVMLPDERVVTTGRADDGAPALK